MSEWTSLSCKTETKERIKELQGDDESQDDVLNRALDALGDEPEASINEDMQDMVAEVFSREQFIETQRDTPQSEMQEQLDELVELMKHMDVVSRNQQVIKRIDDLETELKTHLERELRQ